MGGNIKRSVEIANDTCFLGQNAGKQYIDSAAFAASTVPAPAASLSDVQTVQIEGSPVGGTFTLSYGGTATSALPHNAGTSAVQAALEAIAALTDKVQVGGKTGGPYVVRFIGALAGQAVTAITANGASLTGGLNPKVKVLHSVVGGTPNGDNRFKIGSGDFPGTVVKVITEDGRKKVREYDGSGTILGIVDGVEEFIINSKAGDRDVAVYNAAGLVVDARKVHNYAIYKSAIDTWAAAHAVTIKHG